MLEPPPVKWQEGGGPIGRQEHITGEGSNPGLTAGDMPLSDWRGSPLQARLAVN